MNEVVLDDAAAKAADASAAGQGFLGTGSSLVAELSYVAMALILGYVAFSLLRYYVPGFRPFSAITGALGLRDH